MYLNIFSLIVNSGKQAKKSYHIQKCNSTQKIMLLHTVTTILYYPGECDHYALEWNTKEIAKTTISQACTKEDTVYYLHAITFQHT